MQSNQEPLVSFEQAKGLRALGFDWECFHIFSGKQIEISFPHGVDKSIVSEVSTLRPTISQALRWFRIEKDFYPHIVPINKKPYQFCFSTNSIAIESFDWTRYDSYDECESALLDKLIELNSKGHE